MSKLNGSWKITIHTYMGDMRSTLNASVDGNVVTGTVTDASNGAVANVENGVVDGNKICYEITIKTPVGNMTNHLEGELGEDDILRGQSENAMGKFDFEAVRGSF